MEQISPGSTKHNTFLEIFVGTAFQLEKVNQTFSSFNPCPFLPSVAIDGFHCHSTKNYIGNRSVEEAKKMKCYKRLIYVQVSGLCDSVSELFTETFHVPL